MTENITYIDTYGNNQFGLYGNTFKYKDALKNDIGGQWVTDNLEKQRKKGWIFHNNLKPVVLEFLEKKGVTLSEPPVKKISSSSSTTSSKNSESQTDIFIENGIELENRIKELEKIVEIRDRTILKYLMQKEEMTKNYDEIFDDYEKIVDKHNELTEKYNNLSEKYNAEHLLSDNDE